MENLDQRVPDAPQGPGRDPKQTAATSDPLELRCPHCGHDGKTRKSITNSKIRTAPFLSLGFRYLEDIVSWREVKRVDMADILGTGKKKPTVIVAGYYESGEGYDDGHNPRIECRACLGEFPIPAGLEVDFV